MPDVFGAVVIIFFQSLSWYDSVSLYILKLIGLEALSVMLMIVRYIRRVASDDHHIGCVIQPTCLFFVHF
jgi:hypothetical protein